MLVRLEKRDKVTPKTQAHGTVEGMMNPEPENLSKRKKKMSSPNFGVLVWKSAKGRRE
jgi:hypothetical protein